MGRDGSSVGDHRDRGDGDAADHASAFRNGLVCTPQRVAIETVGTSPRGGRVSLLASPLPYTADLTTNPDAARRHRAGMWTSPVLGAPF